jgi:DNA repair protein RadC
MTLKGIHTVDMPRERLEKYGTDKMKDAELMAVLLGSGITGLNVLDLSKKVIAVIKSARADAKDITLETLIDVRGLGKAKALAILASLSLGERLQAKEKIKIITPRDVWLLASDFRESKREHVVAVYLDAQNQLLLKHVVSVGILDEALVHPREVFEPAVRLSAASVILVHNHPSGDTTPSTADIELTSRLVAAGYVLGIELLDHCIVTKDDCASLKELGHIAA